MYHNIHTDFILEPILDVLSEGVNACKGVGDGIETQPLSEYVLSSLFLKATGAQEQKLKCICWEIATHDYDYRYNLLKGKNSEGECSDYNSKNKVYSQLIEQIRTFTRQAAYEIADDVTKELIDNAIKKVGDLFRNTNISAWNERVFVLYNAEIEGEFKDLSRRNQIFPKGQNPPMFQSDLKNIYDTIVHKHRNRLAHNITSYQRHLPSFEALAMEGYNRQNYFYRFTLLVLIDSIFIHLYKEYRKSLEDYSSYL